MFLLFSIIVNSLFSPFTFIAECERPHLIPSISPLALSRMPKVYEALAKAVAPSISGDYTKDIKKAIICQLFGGSRKVLPDATRLRGDINVLLMGDPSTAKSQARGLASTDFHICYL